jgi:hypothetical protein
MLWAHYLASHKNNLIIDDFEVMEGLFLQSKKLMTNKKSPSQEGDLGGG